MLIWLPAMIVILVNAANIWNTLQMEMVIGAYDYAEYTELMQERNAEVSISEEDYNTLRATLAERERVLSDVNYEAYLERVGADSEQVLTQEEFRAVRLSSATSLQNAVLKLLLWLFPCIAITGPFTAGVCYVTRNWARDEHAFIWSDFRDALKDNWKIPLILSTITGALPMLVFQGWLTYGSMATGNMVMILPQVLVILVGILWSLAITYMHPLTVTYDLKLKDVLRNGALLAIARLPFSTGIRLLHCVPALIAVAAVWFFNLDPVLALMILSGYYMIIGFGLSRFITASYTNAVFDRFINPRIEGAKVNQGLREKDDYTDEDETGEETEQ